LSQEELVRLLDLAVKIKRTPSRYARSLAGRSLSLLFEKPSLRTRLTFELAIKQLGGDSVLFTGPIAEREPLKDVARNLARWTNGIVARTFLQETIQGLADWSSVPVINALSDLYHPCQALADALTLKERFGSLHGLKLAFVGDGNNVAHSLMLTCVRLGMTVAVATPEGYDPHPDVVCQSRDLAGRFGGALQLSHDPAAAVRGARAVYTDVWASMGQEAETQKRLEAFRPFQVNENLMAQAPGDAIFLHCLPAKRGQETTDEVIESPQSAVFDQAENRLHAQKALLMMMLG
ncbi:MAG: ornithine carbamoyltransferase, partial [Bryobacteraceae bacterium]